MRSTARWLIEPLSVISPLSIDGGSASSVRARDAAGAAGAFAPQPVDERLEERAHRRRRAAPRPAGAVGEARRACGTRRPRKDQQPTSSRSAPVITASCTHGAPAAMIARAQRTDADEGAGRQLEVFGDAAVEHQALARVGRDRSSAPRRRCSRSLRRRSARAVCFGLRASSRASRWARGSAPRSCRRPARASARRPGTGRPMCARARLGVRSANRHDGRGLGHAEAR